ncbi:MAG: hypothetical protein KAS66_00200 [Candidatus Omnitrophica bacterium]|nr:hypothetical protein [Candidatus Omnitrophota bacterium]
MSITPQQIKGRAKFINGDYYDQPEHDKVIVQVRHDVINGMPDSWEILVQRGRRKPVINFCDTTIQAAKFISGIESMLKHNEG